MAINKQPTKVDPSWTFLSNHAHVLVCVAKNPDVRLSEGGVELGGASDQPGARIGVAGFGVAGIWGVDMPLIGGSTARRVEVVRRRGR